NAFVSINQEGLVEGNFKIEKDGKRGIVEVRHGVMQQMNVKTDEVLNFQYVITDTSSVQRDFRNGKISQEKLVFYQPKKDKRKVSKIFFDDHYTVENEFDHTKSDYGLDNKLISRAKLDCSGQVLESRSFDKNGQLV